MKMKFTPYPDKIVIEPIRKESLLLNQDQSLEETGQVVAVGSKVKFVKVGDILYFSSWGCSKIEVNLKETYIVPDSSEFILGKVTKNVAKK